MTCEWGWLSHLVVWVLTLVLCLLLNGVLFVSLHDTSRLIYTNSQSSANSSPSTSRSTANSERTSAPSTNTLPTLFPAGVISTMWSVSSFTHFHLGPTCTYHQSSTRTDTPDLTHTPSPAQSSSTRT